MGTSRFVPPDDRLLSTQRRAVPELDSIANQADDLIGAADGPRRLVGRVVDPHEGVHQRAVAAIGVGGAVLEAEHVATGGAARAESVRLVESGHQPLEHQRLAGGAHHAAQDVVAHLRCSRADLHEEIAVQPSDIRLVIGERGHLDELLRLDRAQAIAIVEQ